MSSPTAAAYKRNATVSNKTLPKTIEWVGGLDGYVSMIDQTRLPGELTFIECRNQQTMWEAIRRLSVRGAPAIGIAAGMGAVLGIRDYSGTDRNGFMKHLDEVCEHLATARPTAVNLSWALDRVRERARTTDSTDVAVLKLALLEEAKTIRDEDAAMCRAIGRHGEPLIHDGAGILTHCNAGALATSEYGTALAPIYTAQRKGRRFGVFACETRPLLQGSRLTAWELRQAGIKVTLLCDNMVGSLMEAGGIDLVITGADRIAANGDVANKIGTYGLAIIAQAHGIPFYVAAPSSTFDSSTPNGSAIPIEHRDPNEIQFGALPPTETDHRPQVGPPSADSRLQACRSLQAPVAPLNVPWYCPAFDVTPARLIRGIITERGVIEPVNQAKVARMLAWSVNEIV